MRKKQLFQCLAYIAGFMLFISSSVRAGIDPPVIKTLDGSLNQIRVDSFTIVEDAKFFNPSYNSILIKPYKVQNKISFRIRESANFYLQSDFSATVHLKIKFTRANNTVDSVNKSLTLNYAANGPYTKEALYLLGESGYRVEVKIVGKDSSVAWNIWKSLEVVNELTSMPKYEFSCTADAIEEIDNAALDPDAEIDELPVSWPNSLVADEYDLEWAWIDSSALASNRYGNPVTPDPVLLFENNATRVTIKGTSYKIPLMYDDKGTLFFRVRPVQLNDEGGRYEANWSSNYSAGLGRFEFYGHERSLNWQATTSFAEEGKRKTVIQYYDGSLRSRQTVTKDNTTNTTVVAESFYDYQGRAVIQVLPAPTLSTVIQYSHNFNIGLNGNEYDKDNFDELLDPALYCNAGASAMKTDSGAARYYSPDNPEVNTGFHKYIPDAEGYPFTEVEYTQDNTGRISRQSGVGPTFKLGSGHETKYYYGSPSQKELDALFGTEAGEVSHYFKTMVRDANGQFSVSYTDMHGRTIATALAGTPPDSIQLELLPSHRTDSVTEALSDPNSVIIRGLVMESKKSLLVEKAGEHTFHYELNPESLELENCDSIAICYDCLYDLEITITDDCNNQNLGGQAFDTVFHNFSIGAIDTSCDAADGFSLNFSKYLVPGSYDITKKLSISRYGMDYYKDSVFAIENLCKTLETFINEQRELISARLECKPSCQSCTDSLSSWEDFRSSFMSQTGISPADSADYREMALTAYLDAVAACEELCNKLSDYNSIRNAMLADMSPPSGQYATTANPDDEYSIFYTDIDPNNSPDTAAIYTQPQNYLDENGSPALVYDELTGKLVAPTQLSPEAFADKFERSWAEALLPYHPEYCKLQKYETLKTSFEWERRFEAVETFSEAIAKGYLNPTNGTSSDFTKYNGFVGSHPDPDPIASYGPYNFKTGLEAGILQAAFSGGDVDDYSLWAVANMSAICVDANSTTTCFNLFKTAANVFDSTAICDGDLDMAWRIFRQLYLDLKKQKINAWLNTACPAPVTPTAATLATAGHQTQFGDPTELLEANGVDLPANTTEANTLLSQNQAAIVTYSNNSCESYAEQWRYQLRSCYNEAALAVIIPRLIQVCKEGSDATHIYGASSVKPSSTYPFRSFDEVLSDYNDSASVSNIFCNAFLITAPPPYDQQIIYNDKPVLTKPDSCECSRIVQLKSEYEVVAGYYTSFSDYLNERYNTTMSQGLLDTLSSMCDSTFSGDCHYLAQPIHLPPVFQCNSGDVCVNCIQVKTLDTEFKDRYPGIYPVIDSVITDSSQVRINKLYEQFMNYNLGFSKTVFDYLNFLDSCEAAGYIDTTCVVSEERLSFNKTYSAGSVDRISDLHETSDGGYIMAGATNMTSGGSLSGYIIKTDRKGDIEWSKTYGTSSDDYFSRIRQTADGGYVAIGSTHSGFHGIPEILLVRLDSAGNLSWNRILSTSTFPEEYGKDIIETSDGHFAVVAGLKVTTSVAFTNKSLWIVAKINGSTGQVLWDEVIAAPIAIPYEVYTTGALVEDVEEGTLVVTGGPIAKAAATPIVKVDKSDGSLVWSKSYWKTSPVNYYATGDEIYKIDGGYRIGCRLGGVNWSLPVTDILHSVIDIDTVGDVIDSWSIDIPEDANYASMQPTFDGGFIAAQSNGGDLYITKVDAGGAHEWTNILTDNTIERVARIIQLNDSSFVVAGTTGSDSNIKLVKTEKNGVSNCDSSWEAYDVVVNSLEEVFTPEIASTNILSSSTRTLTVANPGSALDTVCIYDSVVCLVSSSNLGPTLCGRSEPVFPPVTVDSIDNCSDTAFYAISIGTELYTVYKDSLVDQFDSLYRAKCMQAYKYETFTVTHVASEYHYTLYYYDQAGNLVKTIPPEGVDISKFEDPGWGDEVKESKLSGVLLTPDHRMATQYRYNTLNQVVAQTSPDGGTSQFWYDRLGRLVVSQNAQQLTESRYSYTVYDALGRITEVGQKPQGTTMTQSISRNNGNLASWLTGGDPKEQITRTVYDVSYFDGDDILKPELLVQHNLRNRVSYTQVFDMEPGGSDYFATHRAATYYTYDIHGNVDTLLQDYGNKDYYLNAMNANGGNRYKKIAYNYDLISGKVNMVAYQWRQPDQFFHRYEYDAENKLIAVYTSADSLIWDKDARYEYYRHGPLARTVLGEQQVQGIDYAYTLQGWLKGINSTSLNSSFDIGGDGFISGLHQYVARDAYSFSLNYFEGEYKSINSSVEPFPGYKDYLVIESGDNYRPLYNGNISSMTVNIGQFNNPFFNNYQYDQLNRLIAMNVWTGLDEEGNKWESLALTNEYKERVSYDANGNIKTYLRHGTETSGNIEMDELTYHYNKDGNDNLVNNRLRHVIDEIDENNYTEDIDSQDEDNYAYDEIGNLVLDQREGITSITWTVYGKIAQIEKDDGAVISYTYDASGNRISKNVLDKDGKLTNTWYVRDASGNVMSVYSACEIDGIELTQTEVHLYGSSRLGIFNVNRNVQNPDINTTGIYTFERGNKFFELSNHLGNVLVTISDKKTGVDGNSDGNVEYYTADVVTANDYYPFGMLMPGRTYSAGSGYRYGFNGKESDNEVKGDGNEQDYGMRIYDPRLGRFLSVDPLMKDFPWNSPYAFAENNVISCIDLDGLEKYLVIYERIKNSKVAKISITTIGNIKSETIENMKISFKDNSPNDQSMDVLRIKNGYVNSRDKEKRDQHNSKTLSLQEQFLLINGIQEVEREENKGSFTIQVTEPGRKNKEKEKVVVGESREFNPNEFVEGVAEGFGVGRVFNAGAFNTYDNAITDALNDIQKETGSEKFSQMRIDIATDNKLDKQVEDTYTKLLKEKYGSDVEIKWTQSSKNNKISSGTNGQYDSNISITVIK